MHRNLDRRVEALVQVTDRAAVERIDALLATLAAPENRCWKLAPDGWRRSPARARGRDLQEEMLRRISGGE